MARKARKKNLTHRWRENGVQRRETFKTSAEKVAFVWRLEEAKKNGPVVPVEPAPPAKPEATFGEACERYLEKHAKVRKRQRGYEDDEAMIKRHLKTAFSTRYLKDLDEGSLEDFRATMQAKRRKSGKPLSPRTVNSVLILAKAIMRRAHRWKLCSSNHWYDVELLPEQESDFDYWTLDERDRFLTWIKSRDPSLWRIVTAAVFTGMRKSELWALQRGAVDLQSRLIHVKATTDHKTGVRSERTKNGKRGTVPLPLPVYDAFKDCVFQTADTPILDQEIFWNISKRFRKACCEAGVREIRFHDLRHTFASHLVQAGVEIYEVKKLMRHQSIKMTERYAKLHIDNLSRAVDKIVPITRAVRGVVPTESPKCAPRCAHDELKAARELANRL